MDGVVWEVNGIMNWVKDLSFLELTGGVDSRVNRCGGLAGGVVYRLVAEFGRVCERRKCTSMWMKVKKLVVRGVGIRAELVYA